MAVKFETHTIRKGTTVLEPIVGHISTSIQAALEVARQKTADA